MVFNDPRLSNWILEINEQQIKCKFCQCILKAELRILIAHRKASKRVKMPDPFNSNGHKIFQYN